MTHGLSSHQQLLQYTTSTTDISKKPFLTVLSYSTLEVLVYFFFFPFILSFFSFLILYFSHFSLSLGQLPIEPYRTPTPTNHHRLFLFLYVKLNPNVRLYHVNKTRKACTHNYTTLL